MATIDILGVKHVYELTDPVPNGSVLVFIHGWLLSRHYWQPAIDRLSRSHQCLSYDLRGFGDSQLSPDCPSPMGYSPADYAKDLDHLLEQLNLNEVWLVGHSLGGTLALWTAHLFPERVKGVVCVNAGGGIYLKEEFERFRAVGQRIVQWRWRWFSQVSAICWLFTRAAVARPLSFAWGQQRVIDWVMADADAALGALLDSTTEEEVHRLPHIVSQLQQPVYFIAGAKDMIMEPKYVHHLASFHPLFKRCCGANVIELDGCGHLSMLEQTDQLLHHLEEIIDANVVEDDSAKDSADNTL
ncbi:MAG: alpha/beta hydrolase [Sodalinema sp.]|uniref:alpha/beta fold hydrolase n=1 Tax=Sodalinema sp. TaxID=3080550 RepID=UPI00121152C5|nr:MAG: alpha/beta hydrolase [Phormidium sp. SL48-SHIP]